MGAQIRVYRQRIRSVQSIKKITRAMELIATSRIVKAQQRVSASTPYAEALTRALEAAAANTNVDHPLTTANPSPTRAALVIVTSDRGLAGGYSSNALKEAETFAGLLRSQGKEVLPFLLGRKGIGYYRFRERTMAGEWSGFSEKPSYADAKTVAEALITEFARPTDEGGVDEIHIVYTQFVNAAVQKPVVQQILPLVSESAEAESAQGPKALYDFEPSVEEVLDALLPRYVESRLFNAFLQASASEFSARRRAMKAATDNAEEMIKSYTRLANAARQAEITQEISEIVGGANALADASAGNDGK